MRAHASEAAAVAAWGAGGSRPLRPPRPRRQQRMTTQHKDEKWSKIPIRMDCSAGTFIRPSSQQPVSYLPSSLNNWLCEHCQQIVCDSKTKDLAQSHRSMPGIECSGESRCEVCSLCNVPPGIERSGESGCEYCSLLELNKSFRRNHRIFRT